MNPISQWLLSNRPYDAGVQLYMQYGSDPLLKKLFQEAHSEFKERKLSQVLEGLAPQVVSTEDTIQEQQETIEELEMEKDSLQDENEELKTEKEKLQSQLKEVRKGWPAVMDGTLSLLHADWLKLFSEKKNLQSRIYDVAKAGGQDPAKRLEAGQMAHRILNLRDACRDIYCKRDYYIANGQLPEAPKPVELVTDPLRYPVALQNHKRYVRDYKNKLQKNPDDKNAQAQLEKHQWAVAEYEKLLGISHE